jgi:dihydrofolate synthase / folylpolyglutamate synthase
MTPIDRLLALEHFGIKLGLDNIRTLLEALDRPHQAYRAVHIGGTNGKGSATAMVEAALRATGHRTGRYTSPHLDRLEERFAIDGVPVETGTLVSITARVLDEIERLRRSGRLQAMPTFFEATTAVAFELFRLARVDVAVVEVGLGGRFDATNVLDPAVTAITSIDFDHERHLGRTIGSIAFEKAGIAKSGVPMILGRVSAEAREAIARVCEDRDAPLVDAWRDVEVDAPLQAGYARLSVTTPVRAYPPFTLGLAGAHQVGNALVALRTLEACAASGIAAGAAEIVSGLTTATWPGRLEWLRLAGGAVLVDAAHNPAGARALAAFVRDVGIGPLPLVLAVMADKDIGAMLDALAPVISAIIATEVPSRRCLAAPELAAAARDRLPAETVQTCPDPDEAVARALAQHPRAVVAGSIFLVGPLRARLIERGAQPLDRGPG